MEAAEIPVFEEHVEAAPPMGSQEAAALPQPTPTAAAALAVGTPAGGAGLTLTLSRLAVPPSTGSGATTPADSARRWSLDIASSVHSDSWELVSRGGGQHSHSHCGSSPRSVGSCDAYESEHEAPEQVSMAAAVERELELEEQDAAQAEESVQSEDDAQHGTVVAPPPPEGEDLQPFGSLVLAPDSTAAAAVGVVAAGGSDSEPAGLEAAPHHASLPASPAVSAAADSPRSSYEHPSSHASHHDLYSLSQDGSADSLCEYDDYIGDMMLQGEPDHLPAGASVAPHGAATDEEESGIEEGKQGGASKPLLSGPTPLHALGASPAATVAVAARDAYAAASQHLRQLAASVTAFLARIVPAVGDVAQHALRGMAEIVGCLRERVSGLPQQLAPLVEAANPSAISSKVASAAQHARKQLGHRRINWAKVALALGVGCSGLAALLYRSWTEQARLASLLSKREHDLSKLLMKVMELQRNITAHRSVPLIRHVSTTTAVGGGSATWPSIIVV